MAWVGREAPLNKTATHLPTTWSVKNDAWHNQDGSSVCHWHCSNSNWQLFQGIQEIKTTVWKVEPSTSFHRMRRTRMPREERSQPGNDWRCQAKVTSCRVGRKTARKYFCQQENFLFGFWFQEITNYHKWQSIYFLDQKEAAVSLFQIYKMKIPEHAAQRTWVIFLFNLEGTNWLVVKFGMLAPRISHTPGRAWTVKKGSEARLASSIFQKRAFPGVTLCIWSPAFLFLGLGSI